MKTRTQLSLAVVLLAPGLAVYLFDRPADRVYFVPDWWQPGTGGALFFGPLGASLPSFTHAVFFILITAVILAPWHFRILPICLLWFCFDSLFELAQHNAVAQRIAEIVPAWFQDVVLLENTRAFLVAGTFDPRDILAIAMGSLVAYVILIRFRTVGFENDH
ncbi:MAG: hypothetical protein OEU50_03555 [Gammaproteobacteria bacterium]|nr:hypothetical protein [Gammaproteobacteria bacterium]